MIKVSLKIKNPIIHSTVMFKNRYSIHWWLSINLQMSGLSVMIKCMENSLYLKY